MTLSVNAQASALLALQALKPGLSDATTQGTAPSTAMPGSDQDADPAISTPSASPSPSQLLASGLARGASLSDAASSAARTVSDLLQQMQQTATAASQSTSGDASSDAANHQSQFASLLNQLQAVVQNADVGGQNLINGSLSGNLTFATGADGSSVSLSPQDLSLGGSIVSLTPGTDISTATGATSALASIDQSLEGVGSAIQQIDGQADQIGASLSSQVGAASGAAGTIAPSQGDDDSVRLLALHIQQSLSAQPTSIANQSSQSILSLFRS